MPCYHPLSAFLTSGGGVVFVERGRHDIVRSLFLPCGQCIGCRLERSRQWAVRCMHESELYEQNCFITLTYRDMPLNCSLEYSHFQLFMKRLRRMYSGRLIRFFMCGEYGENFGRPHFHACIFNFDFPDKVYFRSENGKRLYTSEILERLWTFGNCLIGTVEFESAAYVARYIVDKVTGNYRDLLNVETGEICNYYGDRLPEFTHMSLKPGIGSWWLQIYYSDVFPHGKVVARGHECEVPKYYKRIFAQLDDEGHASLLYRQEMESRKRFWDSTDERLRVREKVARARLSLFRRNDI